MKTRIGWIEQPILILEINVLTTILNSFFLLIKFYSLIKKNLLLKLGFSIG
jgi:hypothetical protein